MALASCTPNPDPLEEEPHFSSVQSLYSLLTVKALHGLGAPHGGGRAGPGSHGLSHCPSQGVGQPGGNCKQPQSWALGTSLEMWAQLGRDHGQAGLWGAGGSPCCSVTRTGTDGPGGGQAGTVGLSGALRALAVLGKREVVICIQIYW